MESFTHSLFPIADHQLASHKENLDHERLLSVGKTFEHNRKTYWLSLLNISHQKHFELAQCGQLSKAVWVLMGSSTEGRPQWTANICSNIRLYGRSAKWGPEAPSFINMTLSELGQADRVFWVFWGDWLEGEVRIYFFLLWALRGWCVCFVHLLSSCDGQQCVPCQIDR